MAFELCSQMLRKTLILALVFISQGGWIDDAVPLIHKPSEYPDQFRAWDTFESVWQSVRRNHNMTSESLPLLPCVSFPNVTMSDGAKIFTILVNPWPCNKKKGTVVVRSPYGPTSQNMALIYLV